MGLVAGGLQSGGGAASTLVAGATGADLTLSAVSTAASFVGTGAAESTYVGAIGTTNGVFNGRKTTGSNFIQSWIANGSASATVPALVAIAANALSATSAVFGVQTSAQVNLLRVFQAGGLGLAADLQFGSFTDDSANPGNRTVNKVRGKSAVAIAASTCVITNSFVTTASQILCTLESVDATTTIVKACVPGAGSFTVTVNAAATAATVFSWLVIN